MDNFIDYNLEISEEERKIASTADQFLKKAFAGELSNHINIKIQENDQQIAIPKKAFELLLHILQGMSGGKSMHLLPVDAELSTQQTADLLHVSRPFVVKLTEKGELPFRKVGTHRRIKLQDAMAYKKQMEAKANKALDDLAEQAQKLNFDF